MFMFLLTSTALAHGPGVHSHGEPVAAVALVVALVAVISNLTTSEVSR